MVHQPGSGRLLVGVALALVACAGGGEAPASTPAGPSVLGGGARVGEVRVAASPELPADARDVIAQYDALGKIESQVKSALQSRGAYDPSGRIALDVDVDFFRLRSNATTIWLGMMAGADSIAVQVDVERGGDTLKTFRTDTTSVMGGIAMAGRTRRLDRLVAELARRIAEGV